MDVLLLDEVADLAPALSMESAMKLHAAINAQVRRCAPCIADGSVSADALAEATWAAHRAVERLAEARGWVRRESTGRYSVDFGDIPADIFSAIEAANLAALCPRDPAATPGLPSGSFPTAAGVERLFRSSLSRERWW